MSAQAEVADLLMKLSEGTFNSLDEAREAAKKAKDKVDTATESSRSTPLEPSGVVPSDQASRFSLLPEIKSFGEGFGLDSEELKEFATNQMYGTRPTTAPPPRPRSGGGKPTPLRLLVEGRVTRDGKETKEPVSGELTLHLSRVTTADVNDPPATVVFDLSQGVGGNLVSLVRDEEYLLRPRITMTGDAIANRLDEALAAARFEVPGLDPAKLVSEVRNRFSTPRALEGTGRTILIPSAAKSHTLELLANVETLQGFTSEITLDAALGFKGNIGAKATFDSSKLGDLAAAIAGLFKDPETQAIASGIAGILTMFTISFEYGGQHAASWDTKVGTKLVIRPQLLRSIELRDRK
jgi:hypothetical protein